MMGDFEALAALNDAEDDDEDCLLLDWSTLTEPVPLLQPDPLPPFIIGTHVRRGEWSKQDPGEELPTTPRQEIKKAHHPSPPPNEDAEVIPPSPVISSLSRKGMRKHKKGRSSKKISISPSISISPLLTQTDNNGSGQEDSFPQDSPNEECTDSPARRIAGSLGCDQQSSEWVSTMETPTNTTRQDREKLNTVQRKALLTFKHTENKSIPVKNISPAITVPVNTSTPIRERMVSRQSKSKDMARTLFTRESKEVKGMSQVVTVRMEDLQMVDSDSEEEVRDQNKDMSILEEVDISLSRVTEKLDKVQEDEKSEVVATLLEACQSAQPTPENVENNCDRDEEERSRLSLPPPKYMAGFSTAAGRKIEVSDKSLAEARLKLKDTEIKTENKSVVFPSTSTFTGGFLTAAGIKIEVSEDALATVRGKMAEVGKKTHLVENPDNRVEDALDMIDKKVDHSSFSSFGGFSTAGGKKINVSEEALAVARNKMKPTANETAKSSSNANFIGFHSAAGIKIDVSDKALKLARNKMRDLIKENEENSQPAGTITEGFTTTGEKKVFDQVKSNIAESALSHDTINTFTGGFSTAGGAKIKVSDKALEDARRNMRKVLGENSNCSRPVGANGNSPAKDAPFTGGFSTAGGTKIRVSHKALEDARRNMRNVLKGKSNCSIPKGDHGDSLATDATFTGGFSTAGGTKIKVSDKALEDARRNMGEVMVENSTCTNPVGGNGNIPANDAPFSGGFSTAGGTKIKVSDKALEDARRNMRKVLEGKSNSPGDHGDSPANVVNFSGGFSTAGGAKIEVSEKALRSAKSKLAGLMKESIPNIPQNVTPANITTPGFSTAGGTTIQVTEKALIAAKRQMQGLGKEEVEVSTMNTGGQLSTAPAGGRVGRLQLGTVVGRKKILYPKQSVVVVKSVEESDQFEADWGDDDDLANIAETSERDFMAMQDEPFTCHPYQVELSDAPYSGGPDMLQETVEEEEGSGGFAAPFSKAIKKRMVEECDLGSVMRKRQRVAEMEVKEGKQMVSVEEGREKSRKKQKELIQSKMKKKIRVLPGRLWKLRSSNERISMKKVNVIWTDSMRSRVRLTATTALEWRFAGSDYFSSEAAEMNTAGLALGDGVVVVLSDEGDLGVEEFNMAFLCSPGVDPKLVPNGWVKNHFGQIVWWLDSLESRLDMQVLTPSAVMDRLKYRYDREMDRGERSILRKVLEKDESAAVPMVLCVSQVSSTRLVLTDGWYSLPSTIQLGTPLHKMVERGKVAEGMKLITQGAEIVGPQAEEACPPLECEGRELKIYLNSTRRVRWPMKLGMSRPIMVSLSSLVVGGGITAMLKVVVARVYPLMYFFKEKERSKFISEKEWEKMQRRNGKDKSMEELFSQVQKEVMEEEKNLQKGQKRKRVTEKELAKLECGDDLLEILSGCEDPVLLGMLSKHQLKAMEEARMEKHEEIRKKIAEMVSLKVGNRPAEATPVLKVRVEDRSDGVSSGLVTVWRPGQVWVDMQEGKRVGLTGAQVSRVDGHTAHLTMGKHAQVEELVSQNVCSTRTISVLDAVCQPGFRPAFNELDLVVVVLDVGLAKEGGFQSITLTDESMASVKLLVWGGVAGAGVQDTLQPGHVVSCKNLEWRSSSISTWPLPSIYLTEHSVLSLHPRDQVHSLAVKQLQHMVKTTQFMVKAREKLSRQMNSRHSRYPMPPTTPGPTLAAPTNSNSRQSRYPTPPTTPSTSTPPTISAWTKATLSTSTSSRLAKLDAYTNNLSRQGCKLPPVVAPLPPPSPKVMTPYKPPQGSQSVREDVEDMVNISSQEMEEFAMEMMDELDM